MPFKIIDSAPKCTLKTNYSIDRDVKHFSSSSVYGDNKNLPLGEDLKELKPLSPYAESKLKNENLSICAK